MSMIGFRKFMEYQASPDDIKTMVTDVLEADPNSDTVRNAPLADYEKRKDILSQPELQSIISNLPNRGAIIQMVQNAERDTNITVGMLIDAIASKIRPSQASF